MRCHLDFLHTLQEALVVLVDDNVAVWRAKLVTQLCRRTARLTPRVRQPGQLTFFHLLLLSVSPPLHFARLAIDGRTRILNHVIVDVERSLLDAVGHARA